MDSVYSTPDNDSHAFTYLPVDENLGSTFLTRGSAADIWKVKGDVANSGDSSCLYISKAIRVSPEDFMSYARSKPTDTNKPSSNKVSWEYFLQKCKEKVLLWIQLTHENVVKVYGLQRNLSICVEYCPKGSLREYLQAKSDGYLPKENIIRDVLEGMKYMHSREPPVVHGNLNAGKIFIDAGGRTKIGEFGLAALCYHVAPLLSTVVFTGFNRWMSPELFNFESDDIPTPTLASDIWALACTIFEIVSEKLPYPNYKHDIRVQRAILKGEPPGQFSEGVEGSYGPRFWTMVESCWAKDPLQRPVIKYITASYLEGEFLPSAPTQLTRSHEIQHGGTDGQNEKTTSEDMAERLEQLCVRNEGIKEIQERADAVIEEFEKSLIAEREAEKIHREAIAAREREQRKVQALIDEELIDDERKKDAQYKIEKAQGRERDVQKVGDIRMDTQRPASESIVVSELGVDLANTREPGTLPGIRLSTNRLATSSKYDELIPRVETRKQGYGSQNVLFDSQDCITPSSPVDDVDSTLSPSGDPIISPTTLRGHFKEMDIGPSTGPFIPGSLESSTATGDLMVPWVGTAYSRVGSGSVLYYGRLTGVRTSPYPHSASQEYFYSSYPTSASSLPHQGDGGSVPRPNLALSTLTSMAGPPSHVRPSTSRGGLPPPPRQKLQTQSTRSHIRSPRVAASSLRKGLSGLSSWEQYYDNRVGFEVDDEGTEDEDEDEGGERKDQSNWAWEEGQRTHKHMPSFLDLRTRRQSQL